MVTLVGAGKEAWDYFKGGNVEFADFIATVIGGGVSVFIIETLNLRLF